MPNARTVQRIACAAMAVTLAGCVSVSPASDFCLIYEPVYVAGGDTAETVRQVMRNNASWVELCE
jgi:hypothetical protein